MTTNGERSHRDTIVVEDAPVVSHTALPAGQFLLRLHAPACAATAAPGSFAHLQCDPLLPMRRPLSIMRADPDEGWVDFLYKVVGTGTELLARRKRGDFVNLLGPIGQPFCPHSWCSRPLLLGGGVGIPPIIFLAEHMRADACCQPLVLMGSEIPFPFRAQPSRILVSGVPEDTIASMPLLEEWGIPSRLTSLQGYPGCFEGYITDLARIWLDNLLPDQRNEVEIFACGPHPMLAAVAALASDYNVPCQISLEEFMACGVGGCAGCTVLIATDAGPAMKRVCVDGPVFDARAVFPAVS
jgi:dihydroorotate dehydrogenase electron transfer subunit